jgi:F-box and leucine-rich repeat protein GRR1
MQLHRKKDLVHDMRVSKQWCLIAFPILWQKPSLSSIDAFRLFVRVLREPEPLLPYSTAVKRLVFNGFSRHIDDDSFEAIGLCQNLERLTLPGASRLSSKALISVFGKLQNLIAVDLWGVEAVNDQVVSQIATSCPKIQGLNLAQCNSITDEGILAVAAKSAKLRRVSWYV